MNLSGITYPKDTKDRVRSLLVQESRRTRKRARRRCSLPVVITVAGAALIGTTAAGIYTAFAPVNDRREVRCYYRADLTTRPPIKALPGETMPPYLTAGIFEVGFDAADNPNPDDRNAGLRQISDPVNLCSRIWSEGDMNPGGFTDDLIPMGFIAPEPESLSAGIEHRDQNGHPLYSEPDIFGRFGHYIPHLTECVVDNTIAVIPGGPEVCSQLGIPALQK